MRPQWSHEAFAREWDRFLRENPNVTAGDLVDALREKAWRFHKKSGQWRKVTVPTIYNWRRGVGRPMPEQAQGMADVLGCRYEDFAR